MALMTEEEARQIIGHLEDEHTERKTGGKDFNKDKLYCYISAFANEGGGHLAMGVDDKGNIVGTAAFKNTNELKHEVLTSVNLSRHLRIEIDEFRPDGKRVLIFTIPSRPQGEAVSYKGAYYMRAGESLETMNFDTILRIREELTNDYSAQVVEGVSFSDLDTAAIEKARELWLLKSQNSRIASMAPHEIVTGLELMDERGVTLAGIILLGSEGTIRRYAPNNELVWEYRRNATDIEFTARKDYKSPFVRYVDNLWAQVDARNDVAHIREGFLIRDIPAFSEEVVREAVLNAIAHRDYQDPGSVYVRQSPEQLLVESPGGFVHGVTPENIIEIASRPRNRRIAEAFQKLGLVERSGQGADKIFLQTIAAGKGLPDYSSTTPYEVKLRVNAQIQDLDFIKYLEKISTETNIRLSAKDYVLLERVRQGAINSINDDEALQRLLDAGLLEKSRHGRYTRPILSKRFYTALNRRGEYTRHKGIDYETKKAIILKHLANYKKGYIEDIEEALSHSVKRQTLYYYLTKLRDAGEVEFVGNRYIGRGKNRGYWQLKGKS